MNLKLIHKTACIVLAFCFIFALTACNQGGNPTGESSSSQWVNPLSPPTYESTGEPQAPEAATIEKLMKAYDANNDTVGWLRVPGTNIEDSVVQAADNDYYLRRNTAKNYDFNGCYFADFRCKFGARKALSSNTVIYGHTMRDDPAHIKFAPLQYYLDADFAAKNPYIYFSTAEDDMVWKVFAVFYTHINFNYIEVEPTSQNFMKIVNEAKAKSQLNFNVDVAYGDKILTLSTCTYKFNPHDDYRYVVMAKLVKADEALQIPATVTVNSNPQKP